MVERLASSWNGHFSGDMWVFFIVKNPCQNHSVQWLGFAFVRACPPKWNSPTKWPWKGFTWSCNPWKALGPTVNGATKWMNTTPKIEERNKRGFKLNVVSLVFCCVKSFGGLSKCNCVWGGEPNQKVRLSHCVYAGLSNVLRLSSNVTSSLLISNHLV